HALAHVAAVLRVGAGARVEHDRAEALAVEAARAVAARAGVAAVHPGIHRGGARVVGAAAERVAGLGGGGPERERRAHRHAAVHRRVLQVRAGAIGRDRAAVGRAGRRRLGIGATLAAAATRTETDESDREDRESNAGDLHGSAPLRATIRRLGARPT